MLRTVLLIAIALSIALGVGAGSVWLALERVSGVGAVTVGSWTARPTEGTNRADPYTKAHFARAGDLALGQAEGIRFVAYADSAADPLRRECNYSVEGLAPPTRFWTLYAAESPDDTRALAARDTAFHSRGLLLNPDDSFEAWSLRALAGAGQLACAMQGRRSHGAGAHALRYARRLQRGHRRHGAATGSEGRLRWLGFSMPCWSGWWARASSTSRSSS
jgi:hypothetical protein